MAIDDRRQFVHLHLHSEYSLLDGAIRIGPMIERIKQLGMDAVALTDHGNLHGSIEFYTKARDAGVRPILGMEAYVAPEIDGISDRTRRQASGLADGGFHLVLLAANNTGWQNLLKISSDAYLNGFYYKPRSDKAMLERWSEGLIAINGHLGSSIGSHLLSYARSGHQQHWQAAVDEAKWHQRIFGPDEHGQPRFYLELQRHHVPEEEAIDEHVIRLSRELGIPLVCDNDVHFLMAEDHDAHDSLCCISMGKTKDDQSRLHYSKELYVKSPQEMADLFADAPEAVDNTVRIAERCEVELEFSTNHFPVVKIEVTDAAPLFDADGEPAERTHEQFECEHPVGSTAWYQAFCERFKLLPFDSRHDPTPPDELKRHCDAALRQLSDAGAVWRYGRDGITEQIRDRLDRELAVLAEKSISAYFLIVWDFVNEARRRGIPAAARGSAVSTMVGYCLGLSNACPVKYRLLFERFTDPDRSEYPDIDIDICQDGRAQILDYVRQKYGHVAQIITFGTLKARAALRDVGRVMSIPIPEVDRIAKLVPDQLGITLNEALAKEPELRREYDANEPTRRLIDTAIRLEGQARHASVHAAGVVMATEPLDNIVPLYQASGSEDVITQWDGPTCDKIGLLKIDFLGLRTLSVIQRARDLVKATLDEDTQRRIVTGGLGNRQSSDPLDLERLNYDDDNVFELFRRGETAGIFQFESGGMRNLLMAMKPDRIEDLIAGNALYRPGPMELIDEYNDRKHGRKSVPTAHTIVDRHTGATYGVITYQEQVMQLMHELGSVPLRQAYSIIKAISKKKDAPFRKCRPVFMEGAAAQGMPDAEADALFDQMRKFSGYGFNKAHSTGYTIVAYQTAYLKTYFPVQYMAALLTFESVSTDKVVEYIDQCKRVRFPDDHVGIEVHPPDINLSYHDFTVVYDGQGPPGSGDNRGHIRFGLGAVKGVGARAVETIIEARQAEGRTAAFTSLFDFCERVPTGLVNKAVVEALIRCGAFDSLHDKAQRAAMLAALDTAMSRGAQESTLRSADDFLFGDVAGQGDAEAAAEAPKLPDVPPWDNAELLKQEKSVLGFYTSSHPLDHWEAAMQPYATTTVRDMRSLPAEAEVTLGGMLTRVRPTVVRNGRSAGQKMAMISLEDRTGSIDGVIFSDGYAKHSELIELERIVMLEGRVDRRREEPSIRIDRVVAVEEAATELTNSVRIMMRPAKLGMRQSPEGAQSQTGSSDDTSQPDLAALRDLMRQTGGKVPVYFEVHTDEAIVLLQASARVRPSLELRDRIDALLGDAGDCQLIGSTKLSGMRPPAADPPPAESPAPSRLEPDPADYAVAETLDPF